MINKKIRICHFINIITGKSDGTYSHLKMIFKYLDKEKYQLYLVFQGDPNMEAEAKSLGVKVHTIKSLNKKFSIACFKQFYLFVKTENIDIIHTHFLKPYSIAGIVNIFLRKKMIFNYHGLFIDNEYNKKIDKFIYLSIHMLINFFNAVDLAIVPSNSSKKILLDETNRFKCIKVYYNGFDMDYGGKIADNIVNYLDELRKSYFVIGIVARIDRQKRIDIVLEIAQNISKIRDDIYFVILGDGALENEINRKIESMKLKKSVRMLGYVSNAKYYIKYFDLLLFTSDWEGLPLSVWESMAAKVPIISTDVGGMREILEGENCGLLYPAENVERGVRAILELVSDNKIRIEMGENGYKAIVEKYNSKAFAEFINTLYFNLIQE